MHHTMAHQVIPMITTTAHSRDPSLAIKLLYYCNNRGSWPRRGSTLNRDSVTGFSNGLTKSEPEVLRFVTGRHLLGNLAIQYAPDHLSSYRFLRSGCLATHSDQRALQRLQVSNSRFRVIRSRRAIKLRTPVWKITRQPHQPCRRGTRHQISNCSLLESRTRSDPSSLLLN
jgi:hypothetical protein